MPEIRRKLETYEVEYQCDACAEGILQRRAIVKTFFRIVHVCPACGNHQDLERTYPYTEVVSGEEAAETAADGG